MLGTMRTWLAVLLLPCALRADHRDDVALPVVDRVSPAPASPTLTVILTKEGVLFLGDGAAPIGLDVLGKALAACAVPKSPATVLVHADKDAPWQHVRWILLACAENRIAQIRFSARTAAGAVGAVDAVLPVAAPIPAAKKAAAVPAVVVVHLVARQEVQARVAQRNELKPTEIRYRRGADDSTSLADVAQWGREVAAAAKEAGVAAAGEIEAGNKVPLGNVVGVLESLRAAGVADLRFRGTKREGADARRAIPLPYPAKNYDED
jgi:biopolymer transport protein ExbD